MTIITTMTFTLWLITSASTTPVGSFTGPAKLAEASCHYAEALWTAQLKQPPRPVLAKVLCGISVDLAVAPTPPSM